jgi:hypothetical protein
VWVIVIAVCILLYGLSLTSIFTSIRNPTWYIPTSSYATSTPASSPSVTPTLSATEDLSNAAAYDPGAVASPVPVSD